MIILSQNINNLSISGCEHYGCDTVCDHVSHFTTLHYFQGDCLDKQQKAQYLFFKNLPILQYHYRELFWTQ